MKNKYPLNRKISFRQIQALKKSLEKNDLSNLKIVLLIFGELEYCAIKEIHQFLKEKSMEIKIVCFNDLSKYNLDRESIDCSGPDDYKGDPNSHVKSELSACKMSHSWYTKKYEDAESFVKYRGISVGKIIERTVNLDLRFICDFVRCFKTMIGQEKPDLLLLADNKSEFYSSLIRLTKKMLPENCCFYVWSMAKPFSFDFPIGKLKENFKLSYMNFSLKCKPTTIKIPLILILLLKNIYAFFSLVLSIVERNFHETKKNDIKRILLADPGSYNFIGESLFKRLFKEPHIQVYLGNSFKSLPKKDLRNLKNIFVLNKIPFLTRIKSIRIKRALLKQLAQNKITNEEFWSFDGVFLGDVVDQYFRDKWINLMLNNVSEIDKSFRIIEKYKIHLVLLHSGVIPAFRSLIFAAQSRNIPVVEYQHGCAFSKLSFIPAVSDYFWVWGKKNFDFFTKNGIPPEKVKVIGNIIGDQLIGYKRERKGKFNKYVIMVSNHINSFSFTRHMITQLPVNLQCVRGVVKMAKMFPDVNFFIKMKMRECAGKLIKIYREIILSSGCKNVKILEHNYGFWNFLSGCDALIVRDSTMGIEGALLGIPLIQVTFGIDKDIAKSLFDSGSIQDMDLMNYASSGAAIKVDSEEDMAMALDRIYHDPNTLKELEKGRKKLLERYCNNSDNNATGRAISHLKELLKLN